MKTIKKTYQLPQVSRVELDNEISLTLDSFVSPMGEPDALGMQSSETFFISSDPIN